MISHLLCHVFVNAAAEDLDYDKEFPTHFGIAHSRWATHGVPNAKNSHPQTSGDANGKTTCLLCNSSQFQQEVFERAWATFNTSRVIELCNDAITIQDGHSVGLTFPNLFVGNIH